LFRWPYELAYLDLERI